MAQHLADLRQARAARATSLWRSCDAAGAPWTGANPGPPARADHHLAHRIAGQAARCGAWARRNTAGRNPRGRARRGSRRAPRRHRRAAAACRSASACHRSRSRPAASRCHRAAVRRPRRLAARVSPAASGSRNPATRSASSDHSSQSNSVDLPGAGSRAAGSPGAAAPTAPRSPAVSRSSPGRARTATARAARTPPSRPSAADPTRLAQHERVDLRARQAREIIAKRLGALRQEPARDPRIERDRARHQAALLAQVAAELLEQPVDLGRPRRLLAPEACRARPR